MFVVMNPYLILNESVIQEILSFVVIMLQVMGTDVGMGLCMLFSQVESTFDCAYPWLTFNFCVVSVTVTCLS